MLVLGVARAGDRVYGGPPAVPGNSEGGRLSMKRLGMVMALVGALGVVGASIPEQVMAQEAPPPEQVNASGKGTIGLGLIGAELGFMIPALAGIDDTWAFIVFPVLGATGGALAGWFLLDEPNHPEVAITLLAVG